MKRLKVWEVLECYLNLCRERGVRDISLAMYEAGQLLKHTGSVRYRHIIADEGQDFGDSAFCLLRTLAGEPHDDDIFIVGDAHQRIYNRKPVLSRCGINVRGRSSILRINYRTTEEIRSYAFALLNGISFDDLDAGLDPGDRCQSLTHGEKPEIRSFKDADAEFAYLLGEVKRLTGSGVSPADICIVTRTNRLADSYCTMFTQAGIRCFQIKRSKVDDRGLEGLRVATMHRVKGLEFPYVFAAAVNDGIIPSPAVMNADDPASREEALTSEKCLLYVALTRAQRGACITSYGKPSELLPG